MNVCSRCGALATSVFIPISGLMFIQITGRWICGECIRQCLREEGSGPQQDSRCCNTCEISDMGVKADGH